MALSAGARLGPYEVLGLIGAGGMGEVYKARDTRLDRTVAIKVLPAHVSADPERRARFEREARAISQLTHPHICTLYDVGEQDGTGFLVMEPLEGGTLAERLRRGALPHEEALDCATQIADALAAAHRQGVSHRDLKPGNVMLTKTGAKLLDFGLAKLKGHGEQPAAGLLVSAPTRSGPLTGQGTIVGTLQYMAPEQLEGKPADARTDLFAFGAIVYEMVTGRRAFEGASAASLIGAMLEREPPPITERQPLTPPALDRLVRRCLAKSPDDRWDSAHDVADELQWLRESVDSRTKEIVRDKRRRGTQVAIWLAGWALLVFAGWRSLLPSNEATPTPVYAMIPLTTIQVETAGQVGTFGISPDGQLLVFKERTALVRRALDSFATTPIGGTDDAQQPAFSPEGSALAFFARGRTRRVPLSGGGSAADVAVVPQGPGITWGEDDRIYSSPGVNAGVWRVPAAGGGQR
jgi:serine/threonine protein kinase